MFLTRAAVRNPILVLMVCIATVVLSQIALTRLPVDLFPNITVPAITVSTSYSGASPEDVERTVTYPIEQAMTRVAGVQQLNSTSRRGSSMVQVWFDWGADLNVAEVEIIQNIQRIARSLPDGVSQPAVLKFDISNIPVAQVVVAAPGMDARVLYQLATDTIEPQLERLPGVPQAFVSRGPDADREGRRRARDHRVGGAAARRQHRRGGGRAARRGTAPDRAARGGDAAHRV